MRTDFLLSLLGEFLESSHDSAVSHGFTGGSTADRELQTIRRNPCACAVAGLGGRVIDHSRRSARQSGAQLPLRQREPSGGSVRQSRRVQRSLGHGGEGSSPRCVHSSEINVTGVTGDRGARLAL
jgi:hypothetical protein